MSVTRLQSLFDPFCILFVSSLLRLKIQHTRTRTDRQTGKRLYGRCLSSSLLCPCAQGGAHVTN